METSNSKTINKKQNYALVKSNYRPVSNIPFMAKMDEKITLTQLKEFLSGNCAFTLFQLAYKAGHTFETAKLKIIYDALWSIKSQKGYSFDPYRPISHI